MPRQLWGEVEEVEKLIDREKWVDPDTKKSKIIGADIETTDDIDVDVTVKIKNSLVTQTIEVMKQTEMLQSLIDTYSNKSGSSNYLLNPCQMIPEVHFPPENVAAFVTDDKFNKPIWFIPPYETNFASAVPQSYPQVSENICYASFRKAVCGQLRTAGFTDASESALILFSDSIEEFLNNFMEEIREVLANCGSLNPHHDVKVDILEKAYLALTNTSLTQIHNYVKHNLVTRNRNEIAEFNGVLQDYDTLMKESQISNKEEFQECNFIIEEHPSDDTELSNTIVSASKHGMEDKSIASVTTPVYFKHWLPGEQPTRVTSQTMKK